MIVWLLVLLSLVAATLEPFSSLPALLLLLAGTIGVRSLPPRSALAWLMLGWLVWLPASLAWSLSPGFALPQAAVLACLPLGWIVGSALHKRGQLVGLLEWGFPILLLILVLWGLLQGPYTLTAKPQGPFNDPNTYAALLNLLALPVLARYLAADIARLPAWQRTAQLALLAGVAFVAFLTASRGATLALLLVLPLLLWVARSQPTFARKLASLGVVTGVAYMSALVATGGMSSLGQRLVNTAEEGDPTRIMLIRSAWHMIQDHPWLGTGLGSFRLLYPQYRLSSETITAGGWVHNDFMQIWLEAGLPMLLLLLGIAAWVAVKYWRSLRQGGGEALVRMGYLAGIGAIMLHALANFLFFFALVSTLVGLYLARVSLSPNGSSEVARVVPSRAMRLVAGGYAFLMGFLLIGQVAIEGLLDKSFSIQRALLKLDMVYPRYEVAYWLSVLAPFHPLPQQVMGLELESLTGEGSSSNIRAEALVRMQEASRRAPCYLPFASSSLELIRKSHGDERMRALGQEIVAKNLSCNPRHGLTYYSAGSLELPQSEARALEQWHAGLAVAPNYRDRLLLATAILSRTTPTYEKELAALAEQMAQAIRNLEANPGKRSDRVFWGEAQYKLQHIAGRRFLELVPPPDKAIKLQSPAA